MAVTMLAAGGYTNAYNILDGMEGSRVDDPDSFFNGMRRKNGWQMSGPPWICEPDPDTMALPDREETGEMHPGNPEDGCFSSVRVGSGRPIESARSA